MLRGLFLFLLLANCAFAGSTFKGEVRNLTPYKMEDIKVVVTRTCSWFCNENWQSPRVPIGPDGKWVVKSPYGGVGAYDVWIITPKHQFRIVLTSENFNKTHKMTLIETLPAKIPIRLLNGDDAGPWLRDVVYGRQIEIRGFLTVIDKKSIDQNFILNDSNLFIPEQLIAYNGLEDAHFRLELSSLYRPEDQPRPESKASLSASGPLGRNLYSSIQEIVVDNSLDNPVFEGRWTGSIGVIDPDPLRVDYYTEMVGEIDVACQNSKLKGFFKGEYEGTRVTFDLQIDGKCSPGNAVFPIEMELPPRKTGTQPYKKKFTFTSDRINGYRIYFFAKQDSGYRLNGWFYK